MDSWRRELERWATCIGPHAEHFNAPLVQPPLSAAEVDEIEKALGKRLPKSLRAFALEESGGFTFAWMLPDSAAVPAGIERSPWGGLELDLRDIVGEDRNREDWAREVFPPGDAYDQLWHESLVFTHVANGDLIGFDMRGDPSEPPVVYLSHEMDDDHGMLLGTTFHDFVDRFTALGCPGPESWKMTPFVRGEPAILDQRGPAAQAWRRQFGLPVL